MPLYLIPILVGLGGVLFARELDNLVYQAIVLIVSVSVPLFALGNLLARLHGRWFDRLVLIAGVLMLTLGALVTLSGLSEGILVHEEIPDSFPEFSWWVGTGSLVLGLLATLFSVVHTRELIEELAERFEHLVRHMGEGVVLAYQDGVIALANQRFLDMFGVSRERAVGQDVQELMAALGAGADGLSAWRKSAMEGVPAEFQMRSGHGADEQVYWANIAPILDRRNRLAGTLATIRDITHRHRLEEALEKYTQGLQYLVEEQTRQLRRSEERFRDLLVHMNEGFLTIDSSFRVRFANDRICALIQTPKETVVGREVFDFVEPAARGKLLSLFQSCGTQDKDQPYREFTFVGADGTAVPIVASVAAVPHASEEEPGYSLVVTDIGELKRMQEELEARANELQAVNEELRLHGQAKDSFLSNVSHELRTPLSTVRGYIEILGSEGLGHLDPAQSAALKVMERNVQRLMNLINEMIDFSRMEIQGVDLTFSLFAVAEVMHECASSIKPDVLAKEITLAVDCPEDLPYAWGDRKRIAQVLSILLSNAVKFNREGGSIHIAAAQRPEHDLALTVSDTGIGIDTIFHERVFAKFFQVDSSQTRQYAGAGIGLSIAKSIAEAHGGAIELVSGPNVGSSFTLVLPGALFDQGLTQDDTSGLSGLDVMLVNDEEAFHQAIAALLLTCGARVQEAHTGFECLRVVKEKRPDVVLIDEALPGLSGVRTYSRLQELPETSKLPTILFLSGRPPDLQQIETSEPSLRLMTKPFAPKDLLCVVRQVYSGELVPAGGGTASGLPPSRKTLGRVLVVSHDPDIAEWLEAALLVRHVECIGVADETQTLERAVGTRPDVILIDADMGQTKVTGTCAALRSDAWAAGIPIVAMTGMAPERCNISGVTRTLRKPFSIEELTDLILSEAVRVG